MKTKAFEVAKWEFLEKVKSKAFIISLILMPIIILGMAVLPTLFAMKEDDETLTIGIIDKTNQLMAPLDAKINHAYKLKNGAPNYLLLNLDEKKAPDSIREDANKLTASGKIEGYFFIPANALDSGKIEYRSKNVANIKIQERFSRTLEKVIVETRLTSRGFDAGVIQKLTAAIDVKSVKLSEGGQEKKSGFGETFATAYLGILMIVFMVITSGQLLVRSMLEEKSNRVIEVLLSSCSARDLMAGKILGLSGLGILQMCVYALLGLAAALRTNAALIDPGYLLLILAYALLGYFFYAAVLVAFGSPVTTEQEAQQITSYVSMLLVVPIGLMMVVMQNPHSLFVRILSYLPPFTPPLMVMRIAIQTPPVWEIILTIILLIVSTIGMMWIAGKIFRTAVLSYGKRPSIAELLHWIKEN